MSILHIGDNGDTCCGAIQEKEENALTDNIFIEPANMPLENEPEFYYVSQDNYFAAELTNKNINLYCDSATSCIIIAVTGLNKNNKKSVLISHLSRPGRFNNFFRLVEGNFQTGISIYAAGANPPEPCKKKDGTFDYTALNNAKQVLGWIYSSRAATKLISMRFGEGNPSIYENNLDCLNVCISADNINVSNKRRCLTDSERDSTGGAQTLFCMFADPSFIRNQRNSFLKSDTDALVRAALAKNFQRAATMEDKEILDTYSSTPEFEVPWFCTTIRKAGEYTKNYKLEG